MILDVLLLLTKWPDDLHPFLCFLPTSEPAYKAGMVSDFLFKSLYFHDLETYSNRTFMLKIRLYWYLLGIVLIFIVQKVQTGIKWVLTKFTPDFLSSSFSSVPYNTILSWLYMFSFRNSLFLNCLALAAWERYKAIYWGMSNFSGAKFLR